MRLDRTHIAIRERSLLDLLDLALRFVSANWVPLLLASAPLVILFAVINELLIGWMLVDLDDANQITRYLWTQTLLICIEVPLGTAPMIAYLGQAVFQEQPRASAVLDTVLRAWWPILICFILMRGIALAVWLVASIPQNGEFSGQEVWLIVLAAYCLFVRATRPFIGEVILLERSPMTTNEKKVMTIRRRSAALHGPHTGDLLGRWIVTGVLSVALVFAIVTTVWCIQGTLFLSWSWGTWMLRLLIPGTMWLVGIFMQVVKFLNYLDTRIRREGWEVELIVRAAAARLEDHIAPAT